MKENGGESSCTPWNSCGYQLSITNFKLDLYKEIQPRTDAVQTCPSLHETTKTLLVRGWKHAFNQTRLHEALAESSKNVLTKNKETEHLMIEAGQELAAYLNEE